MSRTRKKAPKSTLPRFLKCPICEVVQHEDMVTTDAVLDDKSVKICMGCADHFDLFRPEELNE